VKLALTALNATAVAPVRFVPLIVTLVPSSPLVGVKPVIVGLDPPAVSPPSQPEKVNAGYMHVSRRRRQDRTRRSYM